MSRNDPIVLVVEDELDLADLYRDWLRDEYTVRTASTGSEAVEMLDADIDVALLDRRVPELGGDEILQVIQKRDYDCRVVMVTAVEPDFDIIELGFDEYLTKPVNVDDLKATVDRLHALGTVHDDILEYYGLASKIGVLQANKASSVLAANESYQRLVARFVGVRQRANRQLRGLIEQLPSDWVSTNLLDMEQS